MKTTIARLEKELERVQKQIGVTYKKYEKLEMRGLPYRNEYNAWFKLTEVKVVLKKAIRSIEAL